MSVAGKWNPFIKLWMVFLIVGVVVNFSYRPSRAAGIVKLTVIKPSATVYKTADFDAEILYVLPQKRQVYGTSRTFVGQSGLGLFHKIRLKKGVHGFVLDTDVKNISADGKSSKKKIVNKTKDAAQAQRKAQKARAQQRQKELDKNKNILRADKEPPMAELPVMERPAAEPWGFQVSNASGRGGPSHKGPFFFRTYVGLNLGMANYTEKIVDGKKSSQEWLAGIKLTGPNWVFKNLLVDININVHVGAPSFFEDFASDASGFMVQADLTFPFMLKPLGEGAIYGGFGPLISATSYKFNYLGEDEKSQNIRLGGVLTLGLGYEWAGFALRLEPKYYFENSSYLVFLAGIQKRL